MLLRFLPSVRVLVNRRYTGGGRGEMREEHGGLFVTYRHPSSTNCWVVSYDDSRRREFYVSASYIVYFALQGGYICICTRSFVLFLFLFRTRSVMPRNKRLLRSSRRMKERANERTDNARYVSEEGLSFQCVSFLSSSCRTRHIAGIPFREASRCERSLSFFPISVYSFHGARFARRKNCAHVLATLRTCKS